jgi:hypothetical protein
VLDRRRKILGTWRVRSNEEGRVSKLVLLQRLGPETKRRLMNRYVFARFDVRGTATTRPQVKSNRVNQIGLADLPD